MFKLALLPVTLASVAVALSGTNTNNPPTLGNAAIDTNAVEIQSIQAHFQNAGIVPAGLPAFNPSAIMVADYTGVGNISPGQSLTRAQVGPAPTFTITPANSSVSLTGSYTLAMVDFDHVGADQSGGVTRHWLVNGVTISGSSISNASATAITAYAGPAPPEGTGPHRYAFLLWAQPESFTAPEGLNAPIGVTKFDVNAYARDSGLGPLVAGTYITVEEGTATVSLSATSPVVSSTLPAATHTITTPGPVRGTPTPLTPAGNGAASTKASYALMGLAAAAFAFFA